MFVEVTGGKPVGGAFLAPRVNRFSEKILVWGNGPFWAQKLRILITLDLLEELF